MRKDDKRLGMKKIFDALREKGHTVTSFQRICRNVYKVKISMNALYVMANRDSVEHFHGGVLYAMRRVLNLDGNAFIKLLEACVKPEHKTDSEEYREPSSKPRKAGKRRKNGKSGRGASPQSGRSTE